MIELSMYMGRTVCHNLWSLWVEANLCMFYYIVCLHLYCRSTYHSIVLVPIKGIVIYRGLFICSMIWCESLELLTITMPIKYWFHKWNMKCIPFGSTWVDSRFFIVCPLIYCLGLPLWYLQTVTIIIWSENNLWDKILLCRLITTRFSVIFI